MNYTPKGAPPKLRTCGCCGEAKATTEFSWNGPRGEYCPNCRECGVWLSLLRKVFGRVRDWDMNRSKARGRYIDYYKTSRPINQAGLLLQNAWHPQKDSNA